MGHPVGSIGFKDFVRVGEGWGRLGEGWGRVGEGWGRVGEGLGEVFGDWRRFTDHILNEDLQTYSMQIITCSL